MDFWKYQWREPTPWYKPRSDFSFIVITTYARHIHNFREIRAYAHVRLAQPLKTGCRYKGGLHVKLLTHWTDKPENSNHVPQWTLLRDFYGGADQSPSDGMGMYFSLDSISEKYDSVHTTLSPQISNPSGRFLSDSMQYMEVSGVFTAQGGEQWLTLGNFKDNAHTQTLLTGNVCSVYMIDDVWLEEWNPQLMISADTVACNSSPLVLRATKGLENYLWPDGSNADTLVVTTPGWYRITASNGCSTLKDSILVQFDTPISSFDIGPDTVACNVSEGIMINAPSGFSRYNWSNGITGSAIEVTQEGLYKVIASNACETKRDSIRVIQFSAPSEILNSNDTTICFGETLTLQSIVALSSQQWSNGSTQNVISTDTAGVYMLTGLYTPGCPVSDSVVVEILRVPQFSLGSDETICEGLEIEKSVERNFNNASIEWWDGSTEWERTFASSGLYSVKVFNRCFETRDSLVLIAIDCTPFIPNLVTKNGDGKNDFFQIDLQIQRPIILTIYNSWGDRIYEDKSYANNWPENISTGIYFYLLEDPLLNKNYKGWVEIKE